MVENISQNPMNGDNFRKIKKIKRPIKRIMPNAPLGVNPAMPQQNIAQSASEPEDTGFYGATEHNLDDLLDNQLNLPTVNNSSNTPQTQMGEGMNNDEVADYTRPDHFISESDFAPKPRFIDELISGDMFTLKGVAVISVLVFIVGILFAKLFIGGGKTVVKDGLQGVVVNAEVPRGRARCGVADRTQGCVLYIMNPQRQDLQGRDFYDMAAQLTGRQRFVVETSNMRYANVKVRPGDIAQINIPPLQ